MNILLVNKISKFAYLSSQHHLPKEQATLKLLQLAHDDHERALEKVRRGVQSHGLKLREIMRGEAFDAADYDLVLTLGGDGTLLAASHSMKDDDKLLVGIRSSPTSVGFLCCGDAEFFLINLPILLAHRGEAGERLSRLTFELKRRDGTTERTVSGLNDALFCNQDAAETSRYQVFWDGELLEEHRSSGLWIATAAGSTAAISTSGGRRLPLSSECMQVKARELYSPPAIKAKLNFEFFFPAERRLKIRSLMPEGLLAVDGTYNRYRLNWGDEFEIDAAPKVRVLTKRSTGLFSAPA